MAETPLEKLLETLTDTDDLTDAEVREELAEQGIDGDAAMARFQTKLDDSMRARAVRLALAAVRDNPPHKPPPWKAAGTTVQTVEFPQDMAYSNATNARHIAAAVNSAPLLAAEVKRLQGLLAAVREEVGDIPPDSHRRGCQSLYTDRPCDCDCGIAPTIANARRAVGLEG